jgi:GNAT superfamily N-acetyltransferase
VAVTTIDVRPMGVADIEAVTAVVDAANAEADRRAGRRPQVPTDTQREFFRTGMRRFVERDPGGAWVAVDGADGADGDHGDHSGTVVGMAEAIRRGAFWGLSMLFVDPERQGQGIGRRLLEAAQTSASGATLRMILTSSDPRALRRYSSAGLAIHPAVEAEGTVDRAAIPADLPGRPGDATDLDLVEQVDAGLRGSRAEDVEFMLGQGARMTVVDRHRGRGYAVYRRNRMALLGATDDATASLLLWRFLADTDDVAQVWGLTASQDWAVRVALAARLTVTAAGPLFVDGLDRPPGPWLPSGWYF